ncbi:MAG: hypothetical protein U0800_11670 [Isosphaeraceae bacterium]
MVASGRINEAIEGGALARFLGRQRWFAGRSRGLESVHLIDEALLAVEDAGLAIVEARHRDGSADYYFLPWKQGEAEERWTIAPGLVDGLCDRAVALELLDRVGRFDPLPMKSGGSIAGVPTRTFGDVRGLAGPSPSTQYGWIEQSHSALKFDGALFLKVFRRLEPGINPDFEVGRFLREETDFRRSPAMGGAIEYQPARSEARTLAILQPWVDSRGTAWDCASWGLDLLLARDDEDRCLRGKLQGRFPSATRIGFLTSEAHAANALFRESTDQEVVAAGRLGFVTGEMHRALASRPNIPGFSPGVLGTEEIRITLDEGREQLRRSMAALRDFLPDLPAGLRDDARVLLDSEERLRIRLGGMWNPEPRHPSIRIHGDYHLGQVLRTGDQEFVILDFEGEPGQPLDRRRARHSPLRDVASMLRSFDYAAFASLGRIPEPSGRQVAVVQEWRDRSSAAFLSGYRDATRMLHLHEAPVWLGIHLLHKALYELLYEINHRPDWVRVPLRGLLSLLTS